MAYRIVYGEDPAKGRKERFWTGRFRLMTAGFFILFMLSVKLFWSDGLVLLREAILPGDGDVTLRAVDQMVTQVQSGGDVKEAITAFCREIIAEAGIG